MSLELEPSKKERRHVWRCILLSEILIGDEDDVWTHPSAYRALVTMRLCFDAIQRLVDGQHTVNAGFIQAVVMQGEGLDSEPFALCEISDYLVTDNEARTWWQSTINDARYPHRCPECGAAAYIGLRMVECRANCRA